MPFKPVIALAFIAGHKVSHLMLGTAVVYRVPGFHDNVPKSSAASKPQYQLYEKKKKNHHVIPLKHIVFYCIFFKHFRMLIFKGHILLFKNLMRLNFHVHKFLFAPKGSQACNLVFELTL